MPPQWTVGYTYDVHAKQRMFTERRAVDKPAAMRAIAGTLAERERGSAAHIVVTTVVQVTAATPKGKYALGSRTVARTNHTAITPMREQKRSKCAPRTHA